MNELEKIEYKFREYLYENRYNEDLKKLYFEELERETIEQKIVILRLKGANTCQALKIIACFPQILLLSEDQIMDDLIIIFKEKQLHAAMLKDKEAYLWTELDITTNSLMPAVKVEKPGNQKILK